MKSFVRAAVGMAILTLLVAGGIVVMNPPTMAAGGGGQFCGGITGTPCPAGFVCVDDPRDNCNPQQGGADCSGICRRKH